MVHALLDTSVVLRHILGEKNACPKLEKIEKLYASELMRIEALRAIDRLRIEHNWSHEEVGLRIRLLTAVSAAIEIIPLQPSILRRASEPFPTIVRTLDALHIATAILWKNQINKPLLFLTHDARQGHAATAVGLETKGFHS